MIWFSYDVIFVFVTKHYSSYAFNARGHVTTNGDSRENIFEKVFGQSD